MKKLFFKIEIPAKREAVYKAVTEANNANEWIKVFAPNSHFEGSWEQGEKLIAIDPDSQGNHQGMISLIKENIPNERIFVQPMGIVENGQPIFEGEKVKGLDEFYEIYNFNAKENGTELAIETVVFDDLEDYFLKTWPLALEKIKSLAI